MVIGASLGEGCCVSADRDDEVDSVAVSILFLCVVVLRPCHRRPKPASRRARTVTSSGVWFLLVSRCWMKRGVSTTNSLLSSFQPREFAVPISPDAYGTGVAALLTDPFA